MGWRREAREEKEMARPLIDRLLARLRDES